MQNKLGLIAAASAALLGLSNAADAAPTPQFGYHFSGGDAIANGACSSGGLATDISYYGELAPRVGHTQDAALLIQVLNTGVDCGVFTAIPSFEFATSEIERDLTQNVVCEWVRADGTVAELPNTMNSGCSNTPLANPFDLSDVYGWSKLGPGEGIRVYLPVRWVRPASPTLITAVVGNSLTPSDPAETSIQFNIEPGPSFSNFVTTNNSNGTTTVSFNTTHHIQDNGQVVIEYGTSTNYSQVTAVQSTAPSSTSQQMTFTLTGLQAGTQYHYRVRYIVPFLGVTWTADRTFGTNPATIVLPPPSYPTFPCRSRWCM